MRTLQLLTATVGAVAAFLFAVFSIFLFFANPAAGAICFALAAWLFGLFDDVDVGEIIEVLFFLVAVSSVVFLWVSAFI